MEKRKYSGVNTIRLDNSEICVDSRFSPFRWENFLSRVVVNNVTQRGTETLNISHKNDALELRNLKADVYVPYARRTNIFAYNNSNVGGRFFSGYLKSDNSSKINVDVPYSFSRRLGRVGSTIAGVTGDLFCIGITTLPIAAAGVPLIKFFSRNPMDYLDDFAFLSAGINVGFRGSNTRTFLTTLAVAGATIFGPEIREGITKGLEVALNSLGWEDFFKTAFYFGAFGLGRLIRDYYSEKTRRF